MCPEEDGGCGGVAVAAAAAASGAPEAAAASTALLGELRSWWEVPAIAHFCSLFRTAFRLPDFEIEVSPGEGKGNWGGRRGSPPARPSSTLAAGAGQ